MAKFLKKVAKPFRGGEKGFTLIELLIVIVILGVLAAAIIPNLSKFVGSGTVGAANAELASVRTAISAYQADNNGNLPTATPATGGVVVNSLVEGATGYVQGTVKGIYTCSVTGLVTSAVVGGWPTSITWSTDKWIKTP